MSEVIIGAVIMVITQLCKKYITPKYGPTGVHVFIFVLALVVTGVQYYATANPSFLHLLEQAGVLLTATVGTYEVIFSKIGDTISPNVLSSN